MNCYICYKKSATVNNLIEHLRCIHKIGNIGIYKCVQNNCGQTFSNRKAFKRHLTRVHSKFFEATNINTSNSEEINIDISNENNTHTTDRIMHIDDSSNNLFNCDDNLSSTVNNNTQTDNQLLGNEHLKIKQKFLQQCSSNFALDLYSKSNLSRNNVVEIQSQISSLMSYTVNAIEEVMLQYIPITKRNEIINFLNVCRDPFGNIGSEFRFISDLKEKDLFKYPIEHTVNNEVTETVRGGIPVLNAAPAKAYILDLKFQFQKFFELPNVLSICQKNYEKLISEERLCNFINGKVFKEKMKNFSNDQIVIPFVLYFDDFEVNNPLGSHAGNDSICAIYYSFPTLPQHLLSSLKYIFVAGFIKSKYIKEQGNSACFYKIIEDIKFLEENGINICSANAIKKVYFILGLVLGDNLGMKSIFGFTKSFNCDKYCRLCCRSKADMQNDVQEFPSYMRNFENYFEDVEKDDVKTTGIKENSIFNEIASFHVTQNISADIMHDLFEGVCQYEVSQILLSLMDDKIFSLETLNYRKKMFPYGELEIGNNSPPIQIERLKSNRIRMSATEMWSFIHFLPLIIGDLVPPENQKWKLLTSLIEILDLVLLSKFSPIDLDLLNSSIKHHHKLYIELFGNLKPKHHFMVHYATCISNSGPLKYMWSLRFESKHKEVKKYASVINSRRNIAYSLSLKFCLKFTNFLINWTAKDFPNHLQWEKESLIKLNSRYKMLDKIPEIDYSKITTCENATYNGLIYKRNFFLTVRKEAIELHKILELVLSPKGNLFLITEKINIHSFNKHYQAYEVGNKSGQFFINIIHYFQSPPLHIYSFRNKTYFRNRTV